jgi:xanthine/CO dehydrogenase XdhC/CoxF family maturation factor
MSAADPAIFAKALDWLDDGRGVALATVVQTWGSAPQPTGSLILIDEDGNFSGSVSGGCVEAEVIEQAKDVIATGAPKVLEFGVEDETAWKVGLACGGTIRVFVEKLDLDSGKSLLHQVIGDTGARR